MKSCLSNPAARAFWSISDSSMAWETESEKTLEPVSRLPGKEFTGAEAEPYDSSKSPGGALPQGRKCMLPLKIGAEGRPWVATCDQWARRARAGASAGAG